MVLLGLATQLRRGFAARRRRRDALRHYRFFSAMSDDLLRDVGISEATLRLLRGGRFPDEKPHPRTVERDDLFARRERR